MGVIRVVGRTIYEVRVDGERNEMGTEGVIKEEFKSWLAFGRGQ